MVLFHFGFHLGFGVLLHFVSFGVLDCFILLVWGCFVLVGRLRKVLAFLFL